MLQIQVLVGIMLYLAIHGQHDILRVIIFGERFLQRMIVSLCGRFR